MSETLTRLSAEIATRYRITRELGVGGMATVFLAHDVKHERDVAIKVLHPDLAAALGSERFLAEIRTTAKLQHPHILPLLDSGEAGGLLFYVMPLVTGESLRSRLERERQLPIDDAVRIAREVSSALDYAHRHGVVHRDIKPENILLHDGSAVVADFGIALAVQSAGGQRMTQTGLSLGTPQYMSPEQAMGERTVDARSDIYSLAAVTYEMLTGEPPFTGATVQAVVAKVISAEPQAITMTRRNVSPVISMAVHRGLEKLPADRHGSAAEFAAALAGDSVVNHRRAASRPGSLRTTTSGSVALWSAVGALLLVAAFMAGKGFAAPDEGSVQGPVVATLLPDEGEEWSGNGVHFALSADGRHLAMIARRGRDSEMIIRSLDSLGSRVLRDTKGAFYPFWSPDGNSIGFFDDNQLKTVDLTTGAVRALCPAARPGGASWGADGIIIYVPERGVGLHRVNVPGPARCEKLGIAAPPEAVDGKPRFLLDGRHFISTTDLAVWLGEIGGDSLTRLAELQRMRAVVAGPDYLLFRPRGTPSGSIFAQRIDMKRGMLVGEPVRILENVSTPGGNTALAASNNGVLVARTEGGGEGRVIGRFERSGSIRDTVNPGGMARVFGTHHLSRDGKKLALGGWEVAVLDIARNSATVIARAPDGRSVQFPVWSPRDTMIAYVTSDSGRARIDGVDLRTSRIETLVTGLVSGRAVELSDWSADGRYLAFEYAAGGGSAWSEAWIHDFALKESRRVFEEAAHVLTPVIAPHGRLIAYQMGTVFETPAIFVRPFPGPGTAIRISPQTGVWPRWSADGSQLYYYDETRGVMAVNIDRDASTLSTPRVALSLTTLRSIAPTFAGTFLYDPTPDGEAFFGSVTRPRPVNLTVLIDWWKLLDRERR